MIFPRQRLFRVEMRDTKHPTLVRIAVFFNYDKVIVGWVCSFLTVNEETKMLKCSREKNQGAHRRIMWGGGGSACCVTPNLSYDREGWRSRETITDGTEKKTRMT